ncbi:hypothetical protein ACHAXR_002766, partial [Thalassiosira sp. AJA248-18]
MTRRDFLSMLCIILNFGYAAGFVTHPSAINFCYPTSHHDQQHRHDSYITSRSKHAPLQLSSVSEDVGTTGQEINKSTTETPLAAPIQLLSAEERKHIDQLVHERSEARWNGDYEKADEIRESIEKMRVIVPWNRILQCTQDRDLSDFAAKEKDVDLEYKVMMIDLPRSEGGGSDWELAPVYNPMIDSDMRKEDNLLQLAHAALGMSVSASERGVNVDRDILNELMRRATDRLSILKQRKAMSIFFPGAAAAAGELHGRKAADAILWFALAGVGSREYAGMYNDLVDIATEELLRFGMNSSCRAKDVLHIVERVAMAGIIGESPERLYCVAADCLEAKSDDAHETSAAGEDDGGVDYCNIIKSLRDFSFGLHSDRPLLGLWRFSTRQRKQRAFFRNAARHFESDHEPPISLGTDCGDDNQYDWSAMFKDPSKHLVVDVGCGMGVSLLGLASSHNSNDRSTNANSELQVDWNDCNFIGVDLSQLAVRYAQSVCEGWNMGDNLNFVVDPAEECLRRINESYPGVVALLMLQFPTPYRFQNATDDEDVADDSHDGSTPSVARKGFNSQLPEGAASDDFMVT